MHWAVKCALAILSSFSFIKCHLARPLASSFSLAISRAFVVMSLLAPTFSHCDSCDCHFGQCFITATATVQLCHSPSWPISIWKLVQQIKTLNDDFFKYRHVCRSSLTAIVSIFFTKPFRLSFTSLPSAHHNCHGTRAPCYGKPSLSLIREVSC